jgi:tRNA-splicing ligase RtcB
VVVNKIGKYSYEVPVQGTMKVPCKIFADENIINTMKQDEKRNPAHNPLKQIYNSSSLPGLVKNTLAMADVHLGYGAVIGGVSVSDLKDGVISFAFTGFDINCGVHSLVVPLTSKEISEKKKELAEELFKTIPAGVGIGGKLKLNPDEMDDLLEKGAEYVVKEGFGNKKDLQMMEEKGKIKGVDSKSVSTKAKERACDQVGTLGSGNHYCEVQEIEKIFDDKAAKAFGLKEGGTFVSIHCGSRALGHQIGTDYLPILDSAVKKYNLSIPERDLVCAPIQSEEGQNYFSAIRAGSNAAFANRQVIGVLVKRVFEKVFEINEKETKTFYDIGHNTAKLEKHLIDGKKREVLVQRKGSTRGFGPNNVEVPLKYRKVGQPVIVGGSMGTNSFILKGTTKAMKETFGSTIHGAGRSMSRTSALEKFTGEQIVSDLAKKGIIIKARSLKGLPEEAPSAYKNILSVVEIMHQAGISEKVAKLKPVICVKG